MSLHYTNIDETDFYLFLSGYREAMLWANTLEYGADGAEPDELGPSLDAPEYAGDIDPETWATAESDCRDFLTAIIDDELLPTGDDGSIIWPYDRLDWSGAELAGHDFALTRNGHGAGFWDRGLGEVGDKLSKLAGSYGECDWLLQDGVVTSL